MLAIPCSCTAPLRLCPVHPASNTVNGLASLMKSGVLLEKILSLLVDDGLSTYRLVCRDWKRACDSLPVKLRRLTVDELSAVVQKFPSAASLSLSTDGLQDVSVFEELSFHGARLKKLRHLELRIPKTVRRVEIAFKAVAALGLLQSLTVHVDTPDATPLLLNTLRRMTHLTALDVSETCLARRDARVVVPLTELRRLVELSVNPTTLSNAAGALLFPTEQLTQLTVLDGVVMPHRVVGLSTPNFLPYASTLRCLRLECQTATAETLWSQLRSCTGLRSLAVDGVAIDALAARVLAELRSLTALKIRTKDREVRHFWAAVSSLSHLESIAYSTRQKPAPRLKVPSFLSTRTSLRRLHLEGFAHERSFTPLPSLVDLRIDAAGDLPSDLANALEVSSRLESLALLNGGGRVCLPTSALSPLRRLRCLELEQVDVDRRFFETAANLSALTELRMRHYGHELDSHSFRQQLNLLTNLRTLEFKCGSCFLCPLTYLEPRKLSRLKELSCNCPRLSCADEQRLYNSFPCLHKILRTSLEEDLLLLDDILSI